MLESREHYQASAARLQILSSVCSLICWLFQTVHSMGHPLFRVYIISITLAIIAFSIAETKSAVGADWNHWRGPTRNDITDEPSGWDGNDWLDKELWQASVGEGSSSPIIVGDRVYLVGWMNDRDTLYCLDANSGRELWKQSQPALRYGRFAEGDQYLYSGVSSTPEYDADSGLLYTLGVDGDLVAWNTRQQGRRIWSLNLYDRYQVGQRPDVAKRKRTLRDFGYTSSPLLLGQQLLVEVGGKQGNLVAFDKHDGRELWRSENRDEAGHTGGPVPILVDKIPCVAVLTLRNLVVTRIDDGHAGQLVASYPWPTYYANNIATAAVSGDSVIITSAYNQSAMCRLRITHKGAEKIWEAKGIASGVCSPIIHRGRVYWAWRGIHCVDFETGRPVWKGGKVGSAGSCILTGDQRLIVYSDRGRLSLVETAQRSPKRLQELKSRAVLSATDAWPHVAFSQGRIICRDRQGNVRCWATRGER